MRLLCLVACCLAAAFSHAAGRPTVWLIGDSTVRNTTSGQMGWGDPLGGHFDPSHAAVVNRAIGGRSSRTFLTEGRWDAVREQLRPGDFVLIQFGHNDGGPLNDGRARASLRGTGPETETITRNSDGQQETILTYGGYLRRYLREAREKNAIPVLLSPVPRNIWQEETIRRDHAGHSLWARQVAEQEGTVFLPLHDLVADSYEQLGREATAAFFTSGDHTHTNAAGAAHTAAILAKALRGAKSLPISAWLIPEGLWMPRIFSDHMVLQREREIPLWGSAEPAGEVQARMAGHTLSTTADAEGKWSLRLPALKAGGPHRLEVASQGRKLTFEDVWIGEVWLCSGQSNMDFTLAKTEKRSFAGVTDWQKEVAAARDPGIRMFTADWAMSEFPRRDLHGSWVVCSPAAAGDFSAVAYYFARSLREELGVPVGLITSAFGASTIEAWISRPGLADVPELAALLKDFDRKKTAYRDDPARQLDYAKAVAAHRGNGRPPKNPDPVADQHSPTVLHNAMIAPLVPYALRGAIWYQGESNLGTRRFYPTLQATLIAEWRRLWQNDEMPFYFTQLAPYRNPSEQAASGGQIAETREAQARSLDIPHTGMAVTLDAGDAADVHPRDKRTVGHRLALLALNRTYQRPRTDSGPRLIGHTAREGKLILHFDPAGGTSLTAWPEPPLRGFALAGDDLRFHHAEARIEGHDVILACPELPRPLHARYAWADNPAGANLRNSAGLPAAPFRTDP